MRGHMRPSVKYGLILELFFNCLIDGYLIFLYINQFIRSYKIRD